MHKIKHYDYSKSRSNIISTFKDSAKFGGLPDHNAMSDHDAIVVNINQN